MPKHSPSIIVPILVSISTLAKPKVIIKVSEKNKPSNVYEISTGILTDSPLEDEVIDVLIDDKTYVVPKEDFQPEKYPLRSNVACVIKCSNGNGKSKAHVIEKKELTEITETHAPYKAYIRFLSNF